MKKEEEHPVILSPDKVIEYVAMDPRPGALNLGRAEFQFCPIFKHGKLVKMHIFRRQQRNKHRHYLVDELSSNGFRFAGNDLEVVSPWFMGWCRDHRTISFLVYAPKGSSILAYDFSSLSTYFQFKDRREL